MSSKLTRPMEPACYGNDQTFGWFWRHNFDRLMAQAQLIEKERDQLATQVRALEAEVARLERVASNG